MKYVYSPWIFEDLKKWEGLTDKKYLINLKKRAVIYEQDDEVSYLYILKKGRVRRLYLAPDGTEHVMLFVLPGGIFGECECIEKRQSLFRAEALSDISLYKVPRFAVLETLKERKMSLLVMKNMMKKISLLETEFISMSVDDTKIRVARTLLYAADTFGSLDNGILRIELTITQQDIANLVHSTRLTVGNILREFISRGLIKKENKHFYLLDKEGLEREVSG